MKTITEIKAEQENKVTDLIKECLMFFAFSNEQFAANKTPLAEGDKYTTIGGGAYLPKSKVPVYIAGTEAIDKWYKDEIKINNARKALIEYELANHEAYYTGSIEDTLSSLGDDYTFSEVKAVYNQNLRAHIND